MKLPTKQTWLLAGVPTLAGLIAVLFSPLLLSRPVEFDSLDDLLGLARKNELYVHSGSTNPRIGMSCFVANHPVSFDDVGRLHMSECGETSAWKGIVHVTYFHPSKEWPIMLHPGSFGGHYRIWGKLLVAGDKKLIDQIERAAQGN